MADLRELRESAHLTVFQLAMKSDVSIRTINRIESEEEHSVTSLTARKLADALAAILSRPIKPEEIEGLVIRN